jgi:D-lyxose ketol-isomerase
MRQVEIERAKAEALSMLKAAGIILAQDETIEITDFGKNDYARLGLGLVIRLNEPEYASKWLTVLPGQTCPNHYHKLIKETFIIIKGDVSLVMNDQKVEMGPGDKVTMPVGTWHLFSSKKGAVIEEITTRQVADDSYFEDSSIQRYVTVEDC